MVTVSVEASWRLSRVEFNLPHSLTQNVMGYGEVLLQEADGAGPEAAILRSRSIPFGEADPKTYGSMPSTMVTRALTPEVLAETIDIEGTQVSLEDLMGALNDFFEKWRVEDASKPPIEPLPTPEAEAVTPIPATPLIPDPVPLPPMPTPHS